MANYFDQFEKVEDIKKEEKSYWNQFEKVDTQPVSDEYNLNFNEPTKQTFAESHPFVASLPEAGKQFGVRTVKSYPEFAKGLNDLVALVGDKTNLQGLSDFGRTNADFWQRQSDKIQINPKYQGLEGLAGENWKSTLIPTITGSIGDQATNLLTAAGGGAAGAKTAAQLGLKGLAKAGLITTGTSVPNLAQEGNYLDKIEQFKNVYGRIPTNEELKQIQNAALREKGLNTALETVSDRLLFAKLFPEIATKNVKGIIKNAAQQALAEGVTEALQEGVSIGTEKQLGLNQDNLADNLRRIGESAAIGGVVGGVMGGAGSAAARPYDTQFNSDSNVVQDVSAKILDNGKVLYNSAIDALNKPAAFDTLRELSKNGDLSNRIEQIAPKTVAKKQASNQVSDQVVPKNDQVTAQISDNNFVSDNDGVYEKIGNQLRNVDTGEVFTPEDINSYSKWQYDKNELKEPYEFKYEPKAKRGINADNYVYSKQEVVDVYNNYIKNPTEENKETLEDTTGKYYEEYYKKEEEFKKNALNNEKIKKIAPKTAEKIENVTPNTSEKSQEKKQDTEISGKNIITGLDENGDLQHYDISDLENIKKVGEPVYNERTSNKELTKIEKIAPKTAAKIEHQQEVETAKKQYDENIFIPNEQKEVLKENLNGSESEYFIKEAKRLADLIESAPKMYETESIDVDDKKPVLHYFGGSYDNYVFEIDKQTGEMFGAVSMDGGNTYELGYSSVEEMNESPFINLDMYYDNTQTFGQIKWVEKPENIVYNEDKGANDNGHNERNVLQQSGMEEEEQRIIEKSDRVGENKPETDSGISEIRRGDNIGTLSERGITPEDKEIVEKNYKNQHELNKAIEEYINSESYTHYDEVPQEIKDWLKKYAGAGGLEKQGAEGKGLLSEYYTPSNVVNKMWDLTKQYIETDGAKVLEPSVGIGRFLENAPKNTSFDVVEMNPVSAKITKILYPDANVTTGEFQERFIDKSKNLPVKSVTPEYDIVIGNPPYGQYSGRYKGLGEGKKYEQLESYFINRSLDTLKDNGILTFIVPSSFLRGQKGKLEIANKCELLDAYRLPNNTFDTTSIGTDIVVLRKKGNGATENNLFNDKWFNEHPEKILGEVQKGKGNWGTDIVAGDKNAVDSIDTSKTDKKATQEVTKKSVAKGINVPRKKSTTEKKSVVQKGNIEYTEYKAENPVSEEDLKYFTDTKVDGTLPKDKYSPNEKVNMYDGDLYNDFNYLQGDIYEKLDALDTENISEKQKEIQRKKLMQVLPQPKELRDINLTPTSDFAREYSVKDTEYDYNSKQDVETTTYLDKKYLKWVEKLTNSERDGISSWDIYNFVRGEKLRIRYRGNPSKEEKENQRAEYMTKLKNAVDKTFNDFLNSELSEQERKDLTNSWNRKFNNLYTPDYKKMPMIVKGLNSKFKGEDLKLQDVQIEGINYLTNKGVGLLGFEVGVGKTLSGAIATVQNMQMGRCKRPLIIVPKQVKPNWIREIHEAFPNMKINDLDNLGNFSGEIEDGSISIATFQALDNLWYNPDTLVKLQNEVYTTGNDFNRESTKRGEEKTKERFEEFIGNAEKGNKKKHTFEDLGIDHITVDEAHNFKNLFADAKADGQEGNAYTKITGAESTRAKRMFLATQYILGNNGNRNVFMLTATPFNNSPLEVFNMLSYMAKDKLDNMGLYNVYQFMENYVELTADWVVDSKNDVVYKQIAKGFKNLGSLQSVIDSCMLIRSAEDAGIKRPNKHTKKVILEPKEEQLKLIGEAEEEAVGIAKNNGAVLKAISKARTATLSPDIYKNNLDVSPEDFVKNSPKLNYVAQAVESMLKKDAKTSQLIYMPLGVDFLPKLKQYFVNKKILKADEIAIIKSGINDDKINEITDSFNDENGKIKLIIGTNKMKEGMNLNKNSSVLYVPYMDWNPTDYLQIVGRIWRRGNKYNDIRVVVPLLKDSSDPFMFQKLDEKTSRINNIMDKGKNYIDTGELDTAEEKINMIVNPDKKATMFSQIEQQKLRNEKDKLDGQLQTTRYYLRELENAENTIKNTENRIEELKEELKGIEDKESWSYKYTQQNLDTYKKNLSKAKQDQKLLNARIQRYELDFSGKDSEENIKKQIEEVDKKIELLKETTEKKRAQYKDEYEKNRNTSKSIEEHIKDFEQDTDNLYRGEDFDIPFISDIVESFKDYKNFMAAIESGKSIGELLDQNVEIFNMFRDKLQGLEDYIIFDMAASQRETGRHLGGSIRAIQLDMNKIGNDVNKFVVTLFHEVEHARQEDEYKKLKNKRNKTHNDLRKIYAYEQCKRVNKNKKRYYNEHKSILKPILDNLANLNDSEKLEFIKALSEKQKVVLNKYKDLYKIYYNAENEVLAREAGQNALERVHNYGRSDIRRDSETSDRGLENRNRTVVSWHNRKRGFGTNELQGESSETLDIDLIEKGLKNKNKNTSDGINQVIRDKVYKWHGNLESDRYDVDKSLNSFVNLTKHKAKTLSDKFGFKVTDKQIREIMPFLRERTELPESLNRPELTKLYNSLSDAQKTELTKLADTISNKFEKYYKNYQDVKGVQTAESIENHISHIWDLDNKKKSLLTNYITTNSRFVKQRTIGTLLEGIDGIEINGETVKFKPKTLDYAEILKISSDNLIKATHDSILANDIKNLKYHKKPLVMAAAKAPEEWIEVNHPALNKAVYMGEVGEKELPILMKTPVKVHPEIADYVSSIFEVQKNSKFWDMYDSLNGMVKQVLLGFSGFHGYALSESSVGNAGALKTIKELNPKKFVDAIKNGNYDVYKNEESAKRAIRAGVQLGTPSDLQRNLVEETLKKVPYLGQFLSTGVSANNKILWDVLHNNFKILAFNTAIENLGENISKEQERAVAQWVNDSFGGQAWELLGIKKSSVKTASRILLSPDWNFSTIRQAAAAINSEWADNLLNGKKIGKVLGIGEEKGSNGARGKIGRGFWIRSAIFFTVFYNLLNAAFREWDRDKHPEFYPEEMTPFDYSIWSNSYPMDNIYDRIMPKVFIGRNSDGTARMLRVGKQFREVPEFITEPIEKLGGKTSPLINTVSQVGLGMSPSDVAKKLVGKDVYLNQDIWNGYGEYAKRKEGLELVKGRAVTLGKSLVPYIGSRYIDGKHEFSAWDFVAQTNAGTSKSKLYKQAFAAFESGETDKIPEIKKHAYRDGLKKEDINKMVGYAEKNYKSENTKNYKGKFVNALENKDKKELHKIKSNMEKHNLPAEEQKRIYELAYKEYLQNR